VLSDEKQAALISWGIKDMDDIVDVNVEKMQIIYKDGSVRTKCEVYTRVMGYHRPTNFFNPGKLEEHRERVFFEEK